MNDVGLAYCSISPEEKQLYNFFLDLYYEFTDMCIARYEWDVPITCSNRFIERSLYYYGDCLIFKDESNGYYFSLPFVGTGLSLYDEPIIRRPTNHIGKVWRCTPTNSVIIYDSYTRIPPVRYVVILCELLAEIKMTMLVNTNAQKTPWLLRGTQRQMDTIKKLYEKINKNQRVLYGDKDLDIEQIQVMNTEAPNVFLDLQELYDRLYMSGLNHFGIPTANTWKRERLVESEAESTEQQSLSCRLPNYRCRMEAVKKLRLLFPDFNWNVHYTGNEEGNIYGSLYDDSTRISGSPDGEGSGSESS